jgi:DNA-binding transcriptional LysR family regulator
MNLRQLEVFHAVMQAGSVTGAALLALAPTAPCTRRAIAQP